MRRQTAAETSQRAGERELEELQAGCSRERELGAGNAAAQIPAAPRRQQEFLLLLPVPLT